MTQLPRFGWVYLVWYWSHGMHMPKIALRSWNRCAKVVSGCYQAAFTHVFGALAEDKVSPVKVEDEVPAKLALRLTSRLLQVIYI